MALRVAIVFIFAFLLSCEKKNLEYSYVSPYSAEEVIKALPYVKKIEYLPKKEIEGNCPPAKGRETHGCTYLLTFLQLKIGLSRYEESVSFMHELAHFYEYYILGISEQDTINHKNFIKV